MLRQVALRLIVAAGVMLAGGSSLAYGQDAELTPESRLRLPVIMASPRAAFFMPAPERTARFARADERLRRDPGRGSTHAGGVQESQPAPPSGGGRRPLIMALAITAAASMGFLLLAP